jgi:hypothetical protein
MGRVVVCAIVCAFARTSISAADDDTPTPKPAPADANWYSTTRPATEVTEQGRKIEVRRSGFFALAGVSHMSDRVFGRIELGAPAPIRRAPRLRAVVAIDSRYSTDGSGARVTKESDLAITPGVQYDWRLPIDTRYGDLVLVAGVGLMRAQHWVRLPEEPFWPSTWESTVAYALELDAAVQLRREGGLLVSLRPIGIGFPLNDPEPPDARWMAVPTERSFAVSLSVGYQLP